MLHNNIIAIIATFAIALAWLRINDFTAHRGWVSSELSRKIIHVGTGPIFVLCWLFFDNANICRWLAALVPLAITAQFILVGTGIIKDEAAVKAMSRSGDRQEILRGPLFYGVVFVLLTLIYWKNSPIGMIALMIMCGGDGLADVAGRKWGNTRLPWNPNKSWAGSLGMLLGGWILATAVYAIFVHAGTYPGSVASKLIAIAILSIAGTFVEMLPFKDIDNITVPLSVIIIGYFLF